MPVPTSTTLSLSRRSSVNSPKYVISPRPLKVSTVYTNCILPTEILENVVFYAFNSDRCFSSISGFASASYAFRQIALRCACAHLRICSPKRWSNGIPKFSDLARWVRSLSGAAQAFAVPAAINLQSFRLLRTVHVTFITQTIANLHRTVIPLLDALPATVAELSLTDLPDISVRVLCAVAQKFRALRSLELSCTERLDTACCWSCFEESASCVWHSPIPDVFGSVQEMTMTLKDVLHPLVKLEHLHLGFFLSQEDLFYEHVAHALSEDADEGAGKPFGPEWCIPCFEQHARGVRLAELQAGLVLAQTLRALRTLSWGSFFGRQHQEMKTRRTNIWVCRKDGKIKVRRKPW
ncbi:hypothetical protein DFH11DRAFT_1799086 [Phellopilus nigrolimitatus]|nr:hypothetical protein DFH11DRAFT_1799086 [Phellopilus nigrolimitatus]